MSIKHRHFIVIATFKETPFISETFTNEWIKELVEEIDMEILKEPSSVHCNEENNEGISSFCLITQPYSTSFMGKVRSKFGATRCI